MEVELEDDEQLEGVRIIAAQYGWSFGETIVLVNDFLAGLAARSDRLSTEDIVALFREHHLRLTER